MATTPNLDGVKRTLSSSFFIYFYFYFWINILWSINLIFELLSGYSGWHGRCANFIREDATKSNNFILYIEDRCLIDMSEYIMHGIAFTASEILLFT